MQKSPSRMFSLRSPIICTCLDCTNMCNTCTTCTSFILYHECKKYSKSTSAIIIAPSQNVTDSLRRCLDLSYRRDESGGSSLQNADLLRIGVGVSLLAFIVISVSIIVTATQDFHCKASTIESLLVSGNAGNASATRDGRMQGLLEPSLPGIFRLLTASIVIVPKFYAEY